MQIPNQYASTIIQITSQAHQTKVIIEDNVKVTRSTNQVKSKEKLHSQTTIVIPKGKVDKFSAQNTTQAV